MRQMRRALRAVMLTVAVVAAGVYGQARTVARDHVVRTFAERIPGPSIAVTDAARAGSTPAFQLGRALGPLVPVNPVDSTQLLAKLDPELQTRVGQLTGTSRVVVIATSSTSLAGVTQLLQTIGTPGRLLPIIDAHAATVPNITLAVLAASPLISHIATDRAIVGAMERTGSTIGAAPVREAFGLTGAGIGVAIIDSGVVAWHDDLAPAPAETPRVRQFVDFVNGRGSSYDDHGHGTHVAGIIAGNGFDSSGARTGIAPGVELVVLKVLDGSGRGYISDVIAALDYSLAHQGELNLRVVNMSIAASVSESHEVDPLARATKAATERGLVVVAAAGNRGRTPHGDTQYGGIGAPGNAPWVLTVGASSHEGTVDRIDDTMASFSSRGPTAVDRAAKPDLVAPGVGTESLSAPDSALYASRSPYLLEGTVPTSFLPYLSLSGTSQAAPVVAGTVALMLEANPALTPNAIKAILQYTAEVDADYDPLTQGAGFLNAQGAVELARFVGSAGNEAAPSDERWGKALIWGNHRIAGGRLLASGNAWLTAVPWGSRRTPAGDSVVWGEICTADCDGASPVWEPWQTGCGDPTCTATTWGSGTSSNVVWGPACGGADCSTAVTWSTDAAHAATVVWGSASGDTVVWGSNGDDTVVWGSNGDDTVVWGSTGCADADCEAVVWGR